MLGKYVAGQVAPPADPVIAAAISLAARRAEVPTFLLGAFAWHASKYDPNARSGPLAGVADGRARAGLFMLIAAPGFDPFNPVASADGAARYLAHWRKEFNGSWAHAIAALAWDPAHGHLRVADRRDVASWPDNVVRSVSLVLAGAGFELPFEMPPILYVGPRRGAR